MTRLIRAAAFSGLLLSAAGVGPAQETPAADAGADLRDRTIRIAPSTKASE